MSLSLKSSVSPIYFYEGNIFNASMFEKNKCKCISSLKYHSRLNFIKVFNHIEAESSGTFCIQVMFSSKRMLDDFKQ